LKTKGPNYRLNRDEKKGLKIKGEKKEERERVAFEGSGKLVGRNGVGSLRRRCRSCFIFTSKSRRV